MPSYMLVQVFIMSLGHFLEVYNGLARCSPVLHYIGKTGFFIFVMLGKEGRPGGGGGRDLVGGERELGRKEEER